MKEETTKDWAKRVAGESAQPGAYVDVDKIIILAKTCHKRAYQLGMIYLNGTHGEKLDEDQALIYFKKAAEDDYIDAMLMAARILEIREFMPGAIKYYRMAAKLGDRRAMNKLSQPTRTTPAIELITIDDKEPIRWPDEKNAGEGKKSQSQTNSLTPDKKE